MNERYIKNLGPVFTESLQDILLNQTIAVIGCGGQGGYIIEFLSRLGVKKILLWDGDNYDRTNLNRQIGCLENNIGENKAIAMEKRIKMINSSIQIESFPWFFGEKEEQDLQKLKNSNFIFLSFDDSQDIKKSRKLVKDAIKEGIPALDCPNNYLGGFITIHKKEELSLYDSFTNTLIQQKWSQNNPNKYGFSEGYKCALIAAEAVNCMVQYFGNINFAPVKSKLDIDIYHHQYFKSDQFGSF